MNTYGYVDANPLYWSDFYGLRSTVRPPSSNNNQQGGNRNEQSRRERQRYGSPYYNPLPSTPMPPRPPVELVRNNPSFYEALNNLNDPGPIKYSMRPKGELVSEYICHQWVCQNPRPGMCPEYYEAEGPFMSAPGGEGAAPCYCVATEAILRK